MNPGAAAEAQRMDQGQDDAFRRFADSQPVLNMLSLLGKAGRGGFNGQGAWEACLCALVIGLEPNCRVQRLLEALPCAEGAMDSAGFLNTLAHLGYRCRPADSRLEDIDGRLLPGVFIPGEGVPCVVLGRGGDGGLRFYDPVSKLVSAVPPSFDREGRVWFFQKYDESRARTSRFMRKGSGHSWFRALLGRFRGTFAQVMAAGLVLNMIALATPLFIMLVYDRVIAANAGDALPMIAAGAFIAIAFEWKLRNIRSSGLSWLAGRLDNVVGNKIFAHLVGLSPDLVEKASVAAQIARIKTFESVRDFFCGSVFLSVVEAPFVVLSVAAVAFIAGPLVFVPLSMILGYAVLFWLVRRGVKTTIRVAARASSARQQFVIETFEKLENVRSHGMTGKWREKFRHLSGREMMAHFRLGWLGAVAETSAHGLTVLAAVATVGFGVHMIWAGEMSTGALVASMILVWRILTPFYSVCTMIPRLEQLRNSIIQVNDLVDIETEADEARSFARLPRMKGAVSFHNVSFRYADDSDEVFSGLSFEAAPGDLVAVTGPDGAGKAAVLRLIKSMNFASGGVVRIDGFDIRQLDAPDLRRQIAYVPKYPRFFKGSVLENLRLVNPLASMEDVRTALELADAQDSVRNLPEGLDTVIGSRGGVNMTSGLMTRLSLARAYLHPSRILLIDELPNTLLSGKAGGNLKEYLSLSKGKRTVVMSTHREDFMKIADTVVWLRGLDAPVSGPREDVFGKMGVFSGGMA